MSRAEYDVRVLSTAEEDLAEIVLYIAEDSPSSAEAVLARIEKNISLLETNPLLGRAAQEEELSAWGYRYLVVGNHLVFYTVEKHIVYVHRILRGTRDYLALLGSPAVDPDA
jgi:toxin ParE1/3/4